MKEQTKPQIKPAVSIKPANKQEHKGQKKLILFLSLLFLGALFVSFVTPVYYVPLFSNISSKYGLSVDIARKLTLLDLALNSLGVETNNMKNAFKKHDVVYEPEILLTSRFDMGGGSNERLINAKQTYYHEYERTHKRPAEVAGIYKDDKEANTPEIDGDLKGVRALPKDDYFDDDFTDFKYKGKGKGTNTATGIKDEIMGSKRRQVRGSFDKADTYAQSSDGQGPDGNTKPSKPEPLPDFASSIYDDDGKEVTQTLENSRIVKPVVSGPEFTVKKKDDIVNALVADSNFTSMLSPIGSFGVHNKVLGFYVKDDLPKLDLLNFYGLSGQDAFVSYFYSHAAVTRKYDESTKHLSEIAFHGDEPQDEILVARGQKEKNVPTIDPMDMSPLELVLTVKHNMKECREAGERYRQEVAPLKTAYENAKAKLRKISHGDSVDGLENVAEAGVPGSCEEYTWTPFGQTPAGRRTFRLRNKWNNLVDEAKEKCVAIRNKERTYAEACKMNYSNDPNKDTCEAIEDLRVKGGTDWWEFFQGICRANVIWQWPNFHHAKTFHGCGGLEMWDSQGEIAARNDCETKQNNLFNEIDANVQLQAKDGFVFVD